MKNKTLVILAAGMGSRFGGLKQMTPFGPNGEFIIDYSIYDAIRCGFNRIVIVIKKENYKEFRETIGKRMQRYLNGHNVIVTYCFQNLSNVPSISKIPESRVKPLGTAHAILCTKESITSPFLIINSDDFYGYQAFKDASDFMDKNVKEEMAIVGYNVINTLTENGTVKRGICISENNKLIKIIESTIKKENDKIIATPLSSNKPFEIPTNMKVSMNMTIMYPGIFDSLSHSFSIFMRDANLETDEFLLPDFLTSKIQENQTIHVINTNAVWTGVTYKEDTPTVIEFINKEIEKKVYPNNLWN